MLKTRLYEEHSVLADNVKFRCECELQWEAPKSSRD